MNWWKIYFWIYALLTVAGAFWILDYAPLGIGDIVSLVLSAVLGVGTYAYVYSKRIWPSKVWRVMFWVMVVTTVDSLLEAYVFRRGIISTLLPFLQVNFPVSKSDIVAGTALSIPALLAIYRLSMGKER